MTRLQFFATQGLYMDIILQKALQLSRRQKIIIQALLDFIIVVSSVFVAMWLRLESLRFSGDLSFWIIAAIAGIATVSLFYGLGIYKTIIRFINDQILRTIFLSGVGAALLMYIFSVIIGAPVPRAVPFIFLVLLCIGSVGMRLFIQLILRGTAAVNQTRVLIYGAGESGRQLATALRHNGEYFPVAFIDDDQAMHGSAVNGLKVFAPNKTQTIAKNTGVSRILLAIPSATRQRKREIITMLDPLGFDIRTMPGMSDIISGKAKFDELVKVSPEELLGRDPVPPRPDLMAKNITGKVVLVSGAGGSIGSELCRQILEFKPAALVLFEVSEFGLYRINLELSQYLAARGQNTRLEAVLGSVQNIGRVQAILKNFGVQSIYHAAAYKHVVLVEENVVEGVRNNVFGTRVMAQAAADTGVENFILISTDKAVRPTNFMGATKRMAELVCQSLAHTDTKTNFSMVRFGNVLGSSGSVIPRFQDQIKQGGPVTVTHRDITRFFMTIPEAAQLVIQAGAMAKGGDVFVLDMGDPVKIFDLASTMIRLHGLKPYFHDETAVEPEYIGDIAIKITGLNKGEKLFEELLIGENPQPTEHERIMTATEVSMARDALDACLDSLMQACLDFDIKAIQKIFLDAPLAYQPNDDEIHDLMWLRKDEA